MKENSIIHLKGMEFYAYHGVLPEEKRIGQRFQIDLDLYPAVWPDSDQLSGTIDYSLVFAAVRECVENEKYQLLESLAERIASRLLDDFFCFKVRVEVHKPNAPIPGIVRDISVEIIREEKV